MEQEAKALSTDDLKLLQIDRINYIMYDDLARMSLKDVFEGSPCAIILLDIHNGRETAPVGHWIALLEYNDYVEHFDSYGLTIDEERAYTHDGPYLTKVLKGVRVRESKYRFQEMREDVNTCGRWCVVRCNEYFRSNGRKNLSDFYRFIEKWGINGDALVTLLTFYPPFLGRSKGT